MSNLKMPSYDYQNKVRMNKMARHVYRNTGRYTAGHT